MWRCNRLPGNRLCCTLRGPGHGGNNLVNPAPGLIRLCAPHEHACSHGWRHDIRLHNVIGRLASVSERQPRLRLPHSTHSIVTPSCCPAFPTPLTLPQHHNTHTQQTQNRPASLLMQTFSLARRSSHLTPTPQPLTPQSSQTSQTWRARRVRARARASRRVRGKGQVARRLRPSSEQVVEEAVSE